MPVPKNKKTVCPNLEIEKLYLKAAWCCNYEEISADEDQQSSPSTMYGEAGTGS